MEIPYVLLQYQKHSFVVKLDGKYKSNKIYIEKMIKGYLEIFKYLVSQGADVRAKDDWCIRWACKFGHLEVVKYLVSQGADVRADDNWSIKYAAEKGHSELVKYLFSQGAKVRVNVVI